MFSPFNLFEPFRIGASTGGSFVTVPIALTAPDGTVFTDADGNILTYGTARVRPIEDPE